MKLTRIVSILRIFAPIKTIVMMKKTMLLPVVAMALLTSCGGKLGALSVDNFKVVPDP